MKIQKLFSFFLLSCAAAYSQGYVDLVRFDGHYSNVRNDSDQKKELFIIQTQFFIPLIQKNERSFFLNPRFERIFLNSEDKKFNLLHSAYPFGFKSNFNKKWGFTSIIIPRINGISNNSFQIGTLNTLNVNNSENLSQRLGLYFNTEFFGPFLVPLYGIDWKFKQKWRLYGLFPFSMAIENRNSAVIAYGLVFNAIINSFRPMHSIASVGYIQRNSNELNFYFDYFFFKNFVFEGRIGYSFGRKYTGYHEKDKVDLQISLVRFGDHRPEIKPIIEDGMIIQLSILYRFKTDY